MNSVALCELAWVLDSCYGLAGPDILDAVERLLHVEQIEVEAGNTILRALHECRGTTADFADCVRGHLDTQTGCTATYTLDKHAARLAGYVLLK